MAGLCSLKMLLLCAGIIGLANSTPPTSISPSTTTTSASTQTESQSNTTQNQTSPPATTVATAIKVITQTPPPPQCSYTVTPIKSGFRINITSSTNGSYTININEEGRPETGMKFEHTNQTSSHEIKHLKPCTKYEHNVAFIDEPGKEIPCTCTENKTTTTKMSKDDIEDAICPGYVCYRSDWDISSSLSTSNKISAEPCKSDNKAFCIKPGYDDICSDLITTFTSGHCVDSPFSLNKSITVDFLNPSEIIQTRPNKLPATIKPILPPNCKNLTIDYTCQEPGKPNKLFLSELEPFTDYSCIGQIKDNNVTIKNTTAIDVHIDCDLTIKITKSHATNNSIELSWTTTSQNCQDDLHRLQNLYYVCSCPSSKRKHRIKHNITGGTCNISGLEPFTEYTCEVQPTYNNMDVGKRAAKKQQTEAGKPRDVTNLKVTVPEHNVIRVTCDGPKHSNGPNKTFIARLHGGSAPRELKYEKCNFEFKDLSYSTKYEVKVTVCNGHYESDPQIKTIATLYNDKALIGFLFFLIILTPVGLFLVYKIFILKRRKSRDNVNEDMMLESTAIYANMPQSKGPS
ncbi:receptor-type tyrosine-protein phosphatase C-like [Siniperca chuatsi]|uniref:receptor-type tyrosine-protein phosphatase C-like n=1 Tax=Siniperca chuatsi TaxID=119488 RepID=UPI001CE1CA17|nr:receptor-type tyrosine-protein phosphatase C-like [Siniperca chuatsi]